MCKMHPKYDDFSGGLRLNGAEIFLPDFFLECKYIKQKCKDNKTNCRILIET